MTGVSAPEVRTSGSHGGHHTHHAELWPRDFGRDGVSGLVTVERALRARDVSRPDEEDEAFAREVVDQLLARIDGRRPRVQQR